MSVLAINGGTPVRTGEYPGWPAYDERDVDAVTEVVRSGRWGGFPSPGRKAAEFGARFAAYQGASHCVAVANGTVAIEVALRALGIGWRDEVIVPAVSFVATYNAVLAAGALPVFVDVLPGTLTLDPQQIEDAVTPRTRAVLPVHLCQHMADMDAIAAVARRRGLALIEDAAHAHGQRWRDRGAGCFGEFGSFSHEASKALTAGEGGSLVTDDAVLARRAASLIDCGRPKDEAQRERTAGTNYRLGELQAALLCTALERFPEQQVERAAQAGYFEQLVAAVPGVRLVPKDPRITRWSFWRFQLLLEPDAFAGAGNLAVAAAMRAEGIPCGTGFPAVNRDDLFQPELSRQPVAVEYRDRLDKTRMHFPVADEQAARSLLISANAFRAGRAGVEHATLALGKIQHHANELPRPSR